VDPALGTQVHELARTARWTPRPRTWTLRTADRFYKIDRQSDDVAADLVHPEACARAEVEYALTCRLAALDRALARPLARVDACIVARALTGDDLGALLRRGEQAGAAALESAMAMAGRLHRADGAALAGLPVHDYAADPYSPAPPALAALLRTRRPTLVVRGFEVRNFMTDRPGGELRFFDPHELVLGAPEEDVTRFLVSLLMLNWGRHANVLAWRRFDAARLIEVYEAARGARLDREVLAYTFALNTAMRRAHGRRAAAELGGWKTRAGALYGRAYFWQIAAWGRRHGL
jgi:hypothetical protein